MESVEPRARRRTMGALPAILVLLVGLIVLAAWGIASRTRAITEVTRETREMAITTVAVVRPTPGSPTQDLVLPGTVQPFEDAPIFARTNGYVKKWYTDLGARVKAGQLLAELETPEVDQELSQARADLATAEANLRLAQSTADRYADLIKSDSVARQDYDNARGNFEARRTAVQSAEFNVKRLEQLSAFKQIRAPFDGAITARNIDVGALVGSGNSARELFHIASTNRLRVFVNVPQPYSPATAPGIAAYLTLSEFPDRKFPGTLRADGEVDRPGVADAPGRDRRRQQVGRAAARLVRPGALHAARAPRDGAAAGHDPAVQGRRRPDCRRRPRAEGAAAPGRHRARPRHRDGGRRRPDWRRADHRQPAGFNCRGTAGANRGCAEEGGVADAPLAVTRVCASDT